MRIFRTYLQGNYYCYYNFKLCLRHPFGGQLNVNDVILRVNQMEPTRRVISTLNNTSKYVAETGSRLKSWVKNVVNTNNQSENSQ